MLQGSCCEKNLHGPDFRVERRWLPHSTTYKVMARVDERRSYFRAAHSGNVVFLEEIVSQLPYLASMRY
jgi:hypothetical protein